MSIVVTPQQPGLRSFIVYDHVPVGWLAFPITTRDSDPLLRPGDVALIDTTDRTPAPDLFVIEWGRSNPSGPERVVVELFTRQHHYGNTEAERAVKSSQWWAGAYSRPRSREEGERWLHSGRAACRRMFIDGPYAMQGKNAWYLPSLLIGRVAGILEPRFAEPMRVAGPVVEGGR